VPELTEVVHEGRVEQKERLAVARGQVRSPAKNDDAVANALVELDQPRKVLQGIVARG
jgi:hypothetical protein